jgi:hypothetical protein
MTTKFRRLVIGSLALAMAAAASASNAAEPNDTRRVGRSSVYQHLPGESLEALSTPQEIKGLLAPNVAPTRIWRVLEHGEKVECLDCIPYVSELLYNSNAKTREISAWWLRRRILGVFGPGQIYSRLIADVEDQSKPAQIRAYAAGALGEFLLARGVGPVSRALVNDPEASVRVAAAQALQRLNTQGPNGELAAAMTDADEGVRMAALRAAAHIHVFTGVDAIARLLGDTSPAVRRHAAQTLGTMRAGEAVVGLMALADPGNERDATVRAAAVWALGKIGDPVAAQAVAAAKGDSDGFVRDAANIAERLLRR